MSTLSPLQLIAGAALAANAGISVSSDLTQLISQYRSTDLIKPLADTLSNSQLIPVAGGLIPALITLTASTCPALSDSTPAGSASQIGILLDNTASSGNSINGFTSFVPEFGGQDLGSGDNTKFVQVFVAAQAYIDSSNQYVQAAENGNSYLGSTFTSMNNLITGNLAEVNADFREFGTDLRVLGSAINLENLSQLGSPVALLQQILNFGLTPGIATRLEQSGINTDVVVSDRENIELSAASLTIEKTLYSIFTQITGDDLDQTLQILNVTTAGIQRLSDLLNPVKIFPNSFAELTVNTINGIQKIYLNSLGNINTGLLQTLPDYVLTSYAALATVIPQDQALANQALRMSLLQIKNIFNLSLPELADSYLGLTSTSDLPLINALTQPVPDSVIAYYQEEFSTGTGTDGALTISDFFGAASGSGYSNRISNTIGTFDSLRNNAGFNNLTTVYQRMNSTLNGAFGNPIVGPVIIPAGPASGSYNAIYSTPEDPESLPVLIETAGSVAFRTGLIPAVAISVTQITTSAPAAINSMNQDWISMAEKLVEESNNQSAASIDLDDLIPNDETALLSFVQNLPTYGKDTVFGGAADFLEDIANKTTLGGQAIVACLRQGRNIGVLDQAGIGNDIHITLS